jgi:hypothetical protein
MNSVIDAEFEELLTDGITEQGRMTYKNKKDDEIIQEGVAVFANLDEFGQTGITTVQAPFENLYLEKLYNWFSKDMPSEWWYKATNPYPEGDFVIENDINKEYINLYNSIAKESMYNGNFSFSFSRTLNNHPDTCKCLECDLRKRLASKDILSFVEVVTGEKVSEPQELFASWYKKGDFLSTHNDEDHGKVGFVLSLTKDWIAEYGGNLHIWSEDEDENLDSIKRVIIPKFGELVLFALDKGKSPHFVSEVVVDNPKRIAFTGWYK